jgi:hypothetical protein
MFDHITKVVSRADSFGILAIAVLPVFALLFYAFQ